MDRLIRVIGPAPSEVPWDDFITRLRAERVRVTESLANYIPEIKTKGKVRKKKGEDKLIGIAKLMKELGVSMDELKEEIER